MAGAHTIGLARCTTFREHIYNGWNIGISFTESLRQICPASGNGSALASIYLQPVLIIYTTRICWMKRVLHSGQELFNGNSANSLVKRYADDISVFVKDFPRATIKMGNISPLTGSAGQIRINCRKVNWKIIRIMPYCITLYDYLSYHSELEK